MVEQVTQECMHVRRAGYLTDETPMARLWQEARLAGSEPAPTRPCGNSSPAASNPTSNRTAARST
ncbi:hypothetical protein V2I01_17650 [Micromonospora sp. BRA006-A]|nr:hypothetical protein [Micromonospora sp. BRA006-A]